MARHLLTAICVLCFFALKAQTITTTVIKDDFTDNRFNWYVNKADSAEYEVAGGKYVLTNKSNQIWKSMRFFYFNKTQPYSVSATASWYAGVTNMPYGIFLNGDADGNDVEISVSGNGSYRVIAYQNKKLIPISNGWQKSTLVKTGAGNTNSMRIEVNGNFFSFYLNETLIDTATIMNLRGGPRSGFIVYSKQQILYDDFEAKQWSTNTVLPGKIVGKTSSFPGTVSPKPIPSKRGKMEIFYYQAPEAKAAAEEEDEDDWGWGSTSKVKNGLVDKDGYRLLDPVFKYIADFNEGRSYVAVNDTSYAVIDDRLNVITPFIFDYNSRFDEGYSIATLGRLHGMIDKDGKTILPFIYQRLTKPENGLLYAESGGKAGIIKITGEPVVPFGSIPLSKTYYNFKNGMMPSVDATGKSYGIIDKAGKWVVEPIYKSLIQYSDGSYVFAVANPANAASLLYGVMDKTAKIIVQPIYGRVSVYKNNIILGNEQTGTASTDFREKIKARYALADKTGKLITEMKYLHIGGPTDTTEYYTAIAEIKTDPANRFGKVGVLDKKGKEVVPCIYDSKISQDAFKYGADVSQFASGLINVYKDGKFGYIDHTGKIIIPFLYPSAAAFTGELARVTKDGKETYINKAGKEVPDGKTDSYWETKTTLPPIRK